VVTLGGGGRENDAEDHQRDKPRSDPRRRHGCRRAGRRRPL
jgi:hypothetical protein